MSTSVKIIQTLKQQLKLAGIPYRELARNLGLSESAVKQMFASGNFSLKRLDEICDVLKIDIAEIIELSIRADQRIEELGETLEKEIVSDIPLLVVAYCLVNYWTVEDILDFYRIEGSEIIQLLAKLDRMKLIELLPGNRVRLLISNNFKWIRNGPIEKFFRSQVQDEFFQGDFSADGALQIIKNADISERGKSRLIERLIAVGSLFDDISREDKNLAIDQRRATSMILAIRNWEFTVFASMERRTNNL
jgi:DNA-binding Xre family transcriptional regulator